MDAFVFDMDGVIFDSEILVIECWQEIAEKYQIKDVEKPCMGSLGVTRDVERQVFMEFYGEGFPHDKYKKEVSALFHERAAGGKLRQKPGIKELLLYLKEHGYKVAVASSTRREIVTRELEEGGLISYFDKIVCGDMVQRSKPEPDIFLKACEELKVDPKKAYAIEDSYNGIRASYRAGMKPIMVPDLAAPTKEMEQIAFCILPSLNHVKQCLENGAL